MNEYEATREMFARANMRYSITVTAEGVTLTVNGTRTQRPGSQGTVEMLFTPEGSLVNVKGDVI